MADTKVNVLDATVLQRLNEERPTSPDNPSPPLPNRASLDEFELAQNALAEQQDDQVLTRSKARVGAILTALFLALFVGALDTTIVATAIPVITNDLKSASGYTWIGGAYTLAGSVARPIWAKLSDIWGRKIVILFAILMFFVSSTICATARSMTALIVGRSLQGIAGGGVMLLFYLVIADMFSVRKSSLLIGIAGGIWAVAGGIGPVLGGTFSTLASWRWCFWINLPICVLSFVLLLLCLDTKHEHTNFKDGIKAVDWIGIVTFLAFSLMILLGLNFGGVEFPWDSVKVITLLVVGTCMIGVFVYSQKKMAKYPLMPLDIFRDRQSVAALLVGFFHGMTYMGAEYYMPLYFQAVKQRSALQSGALLVPLIVAAASSDILAGFIQHRTGGRYRELIWAGTTILCLGSGLLIILDVDTSLTTAIGLQIVFGFGEGLLFSPPSIAIQNRSKQQHIATATSTFSFVRSMAISVSIILGGVVFQSSMDIQQARLARSDLGFSPGVLAKLRGKEAAANIGIPGILSDLAQKQAVKEAFAWSLRNMWIMYTAFGGLGVLSSIWVGNEVLKSEHTENVTGIKKEGVVAT